MTPPYLDPAPPAPSPIPPSGSARPGVGRLSGGQVALLLAVAIGATIALTIAASLIGAKILGWTETSPQMLLIGLTVQPAMLIGACYTLAVRRWGLSWRDLGITGVSAKWIFIAFGAWLLSMPVIGGLKTLADWALGTPDSNPYADFIDPAAIDNPMIMGLIVVLGGFVVPFAEETIFRGFLYPWLRSRMRLIAAVALSAVFFSLLHFQFVVLLPILFMGAVLAMLREKSGSIWPPIVYHAMQNTMTFIVLLTAVG